MTHLVAIPWTGLGLFKGYRGDTWLKNRIEVFKRFTLPSLLAQTNHTFILWFCFRPEEETNPIVQNFVESMGKIRGIALAVTYHGILMYDDKYPDDVARYRLLETLRGSLPEIAPLVDETVYLTIQPSDDCYLSDSFATIQAEPYEVHKSIGFTKGYIMNYTTLEVAEYNPKTIPPFSTIMFPKEIFLNPLEHFKYTGPYQSHEYIKDTTHFKELPGRGFIVGTHGENISTGFNHPFQGRTLTESEAENVLISAGLFRCEAITLDKGVKRKLLKKIMNLTPAALQRFYVQLQSPGVKGSIRKYTYFNI